MNTAYQKSFAPEARRLLIEAVTAKALRLGVAKGKAPIPATIQGDIALIEGSAFPKATLSLREKLIKKVAEHGFDAVMEEAAYTWFNRLMAIRYMEVHGYLSHGLRVLSDPANGPVPEVLQQAQSVEIPTLDKALVTKLLVAGDKQEELYQTLLLAQCHALGQAMPFLFDRIDGATELLTPDNLLGPNSIVRKLVKEIPEDDWRTTEILGWLYQFYVSDEKARVDAYVKKGQAVAPEDIPAKTQLFTPNWIVQFLTQNSLGRLWMDVYPNSPLREKMPYYTPPAEQEPEVAAKLREITPDSLDPNTLTAIDPAAGSGHILLELYNLFFAMYQEQGYMPQDIPRRILEQNLYGLELDRRAAQIAGFAVLMRARADDPRLLENPPKVNVLAIRSSRDLDLATLLTPRQAEEMFPSDRLIEDDQPRLVAGGRALFTDATMVRAMKELFADADVVGSLQRIPEGVAAKLDAFAAEVERVRLDANLMENEQLALLADLVHQAQFLAKRYTACVANPPYLGGKAMVKDLKDFAKQEYPDTKADLFAMFIERGFDFAEPRGFNAMVTMQSWMFLSGYEKFRQDIVDKKAICSMVHMGNGVMGIAFGTAATSIRNLRMPRQVGTYCYAETRDLDESNRPTVFPVPGARLTAIAQDEFKKIPGWPIAYWATPREFRIFETHPNLGVFVEAQKGLAPCDSPRFVRFWWEVSYHRIGFGFESTLAAADSKMKWFPYNKGGEFRRWYGNLLHVVNWENDGQEVKSYISAQYPYLNGNVLFVTQDTSNYFRPSIVWSMISSGPRAFRWVDGGEIPSNATQSAFETGCDRRLLLAYLNTSVVTRWLQMLSPTLNTNLSEFLSLPWLTVADEEKIVESVTELVELAREDWDQREIALCEHKRVTLGNEHSARSELEELKGRFEGKSSRAVDLENQIEALYREAAGIDSWTQDLELSCTRAWRVPEGQSLCRDWLSRAIGCMMGRYSLDEAGLIYAHAGGEGFDPSRYRTFPADEDGILPLTDQPFFGEQDTAERFAQWVKAVWPNSPLEENLAFIADNLGRKPDETPLEAIRRYLVEDFYADHLQTYKKRPIYWLFSSGKKRAFQALVYLHRYHPGTLGRMRSHCVQPLIGKLQAQLQQAQAAESSAPSASEKAKRSRETKKLREQYDELLAFDEKLHHYALQAISLDLDDGVKVNYGKFSDILAKVKDITGGKDD